MSSPAPLLRATALGLLLGLTATPVCAMEVRRISRGFSLEEEQTLRLELPVGQVRLLPRVREKVAVEVVLHCSGSLYPCRRQAESLELTSRPLGEALALRLEGAPKWWDGAKDWQMSVEVEVRYPKDQSLDLRLERGEVEVDKILHGDTRIEVGRGSVMAALVKEEVGSVEIHAPKGRLLFHDGTGRPVSGPDNPFRSPHRVSWTEGTGPVDIEIRVARGDVLVGMQ